MGVLSEQREREGGKLGRAGEDAQQDGVSAGLQPHPDPTERSGV